jgi:transposase
MGSQRRRFTREFKIEAVRLIVEESRRILKLSRELEVGENLLSRWKKKSEEGKIDPFPGKGLLSPEDGELRPLKRENEHLWMDVTLDLFHRRVVGWAMDRWITRWLVIKALNMAQFRKVL